MFFKAKCPIPTWEQTWTESRMQFLVKHLGVERLKNSTAIWPVTDFFKGAFEPTEACVLEHKNIIAGHWGIADRLCDVELCSSEALATYGAYEPGENPKIKAVANQLDSRLALVSLLSHELAKHLLISEGHLTGEEPDFQTIADLTTVFLGYGFVAANSPIRDRAWSQRTRGRAITRQGYLSTQVIGYANALYFHGRSAPLPSWASEFCIDAYEPLKAGFKYLSKTKECLFQPASPNANDWSADQIVETLRKGKPQFQTLALWSLREPGKMLEGAVIPEILSCLVNRDEAVRRAAARLAEQIPESEEAMYAFEDVLGDSNTEVKSLVAEALGNFENVNELVCTRLVTMLKESHDEAMIVAANALVKIGKMDELASKTILRRLKDAIVKGQGPYAMSLIYVLSQLHKESYAQVIEDHFEFDDELQREAKAVLDDFEKSKEENAG